MFLAECLGIKSNSNFLSTLNKTSSNALPVVARSDSNFLPALNKNNSNQSIAIVTISTPNRISFSQYTLSSLIKYASKWGYYLHFYPNPPDTSRSIYWGKIKVVLDLLKEGKYDWYVWFDDDIFITNPEISIGQIIKDCGPQVHFIIAAHKTFPILENDVNSGVFMVRNSEWSRNFLQQVWERGDGQPGSYMEQGAISELIVTEKYKNSPYIVRLPGRKIQSILTLLYKGDCGDYGQWQPGDFAAHLAGAYERARCIICEQFATNPSIYPVLPPAAEALTIKQEPIVVTDWESFAAACSLSNQ